MFTFDVWCATNSQTFNHSFEALTFEQGFMLGEEFFNKCNPTKKSFYVKDVYQESRTVDFYDFLRLMHEGWFQ